MSAFFRYQKIGCPRVAATHRKEIAVTGVMDAVVPWTRENLVEIVPTGTTESIVTFTKGATIGREDTIGNTMRGAGNMELLEEYEMIGGKDILLLKKNVSNNMKWRICW